MPRLLLQVSFAETLALPLVPFPDHWQTRTIAATALQSRAPVQDDQSPA